MPDLIIDNRPISVPEGTKVIEAARRLGIMIPRFCYHEALGSVGACRVCAVKFVEGPVKGLDMSCQVDAMDGMVVSTTAKEALEHRKAIIELLMINHPHDCPVCDEGGHCLLQDETVSGGHIRRRYQGRKRTHRDQDLGVFVQHEMNRCIQCWRCRRFYQEYSGYRDLGAMQIGWRTYFGRFQDGPLESPFAGNLIDICPTGVYTDKPSRFKGRRWDFERAPSLCLHCSMGCNTIGSSRYREMVRLEARVNPEVNGHFICDRGRYGFYYHQHPERPRESRIRDKKVTGPDALGAAAERLRAYKGEESRVQCLSSPRASLETLTALTRLCRELDWPAPRFYVEPEMEAGVRKTARRLDQRLAMSLADLEKADFIILLGADILNEAPMAALALRQAWRNGATVVSADPRPVELPLDFLSLPCSGEDIAVILERLVHLAVSRIRDKELPPAAQGYLEELKKQGKPDRPWVDALDDQVMRLRHSDRVAIVCGAAVGGTALIDSAADAALLLREFGQHAGLFVTLPGANAFGAGMLTDSETSSTDLLTEMEQGRIKALVLVETDLFHECPDRPRLERALENLEFLAVMDYLPSRSVQKADVFWPTTTVFEKAESTFINQAGRLQTVPPVCQGGLPIAQLNNGGHPPREFQNNAPGGESLPASEILSRLSEKLGGPAFSVSLPDSVVWLAEQNLLPADVDWNLARNGGVRILADRREEEDFQSVNNTKPEPPAHGSNVYRLLWVDGIFGTEELSGYSSYIRAVEPDPSVYVQTRDAEALDLKSGDLVSMDLDIGKVELKVEVREKMAPGYLVAPRHRRLEYCGSIGRPELISKDRIKKV